MKAITQRTYGGPDTLQYTDAPVPEPGPNEVLIRVRAASVNAADWLLMRGEPYLIRLAFGLRAPRNAVRGRDVAGVVEAVGAAVRLFAAGDEVYAEVDAGSFAEYTVANEKVVALKPSTVTFEQAATVPVAAITALQGIRDTAKVRPGQRVLINGASGGVGLFAVQLAKVFGAEVTAVCSARNAELARELGADHVIDYATDDFTANGKRWHSIFDLVGNHTLTECRTALTRRGTLVVSSGGGGRVLGPIPRVLSAAVGGLFVPQTLRPLVARSSGTDLAALAQLIDAGKVVTPIEATYPLAETAAALRHFGERHARSKIAISV